jgi:hypothetical protein
MFGPQSCFFFIQISLFDFIMWFLVYFMIFLKNCERHLSEYEIQLYYKIVSNEFSIPGILNLDCIKKADLMYTTIGGFANKMKTLMKEYFVL